MFSDRQCVGFKPLCRYLLMALGRHRFGNAKVCFGPKQTLSSVGERTRIVIRGPSSDATLGRIAIKAPKPSAVICLAVQISAQKYFASWFGRSRLIDLGYPAPGMRGVRVVTNVGCGMRWTHRLLRRTRARRTAKPWVLMSRLIKSATSYALRGDGDKKARSPGRARRKPLKPLRREGRGQVQPVVATAEKRRLRWVFERNDRHGPVWDRWDGHL